MNKRERKEGIKIDQKEKLKMKGIMEDCMCVPKPAAVRFHVFTDRYSKDKAYTIILEMRSVYWYVRWCLLKCGLDGQVAHLRLRHGSTYKVGTD